MGDQNSVSHKLQKLRKYHFDCRGIHHHFIRNAGQICNFKRNGTLRIYKSAEPVSNFPVLYLHRSDFNNSVPDGTKTGRLNVKYNICIIQRFIFCIYRNLRKIIHHIALYSVNDLKRIVFVQSLDIMIRHRECLGNSVICNSNSRMSPVMRPFHNIIYLRHPIHITHLCMTVKLHTLDRTQIFSWHSKISDFFDSGHGLNGKFPIELINCRNAFNFYKGSFLQLTQNFRELVISSKHFYCNGVGKVCHRKNNNRLFIPYFPCLETDYLTVNRNLSHL